jgi:type II secretory pathway component PulJ
MSKLLSPAQTAALQRHQQRFEELKRELQHLEYFCKGTVLKRMMKCGKAQCACQKDPAKRHGPYFEWTYKANGKTVNVKLTPETAPLYQAAARQYRKLKTALQRLERLSATALHQHAKLAQLSRQKP